VFLTFCAILWGCNGFDWNLYLWEQAGALILRYQINKKIYAEENSANDLAYVDAFAPAYAVVGA
jgi:hypothetical protein